LGHARTLLLLMMMLLEATLVLGKTTQASMW
jgi:hypothetical protein